jgi:Protein of unknown function (DUF4007)
MTASFRFSGHETFPCRYAWLPKAVELIGRKPQLLNDEKAAMVELGLGKNMVRATRFWVQVAGLASRQKGGDFKVTPLGQLLLGKKGHDPYLEDLQTLWLIHWHLATHVEEPLFAWDYLLNRWPHPELSKSAALRAFRQEADRVDHDRELSDVTLEQHFDTFLHSYVPTRSKKGEIQEDNLDCPLVELRLIEKIGERPLDSGRHEPVYAFRRDAKPEITPSLFLYCVEDYWQKRRPNEKTLTFRELANETGSPGQILKLPEEDLRERMDQIHADSNRVYSYKESTVVPLLTRSHQIGDEALLKAMYGKGRN